jgi:acetyl esterase/lipase
VFGDRKPRGLGASLANHPGALFEPLRASLGQRGFVVASIDYRLPPLSPWPAQIEDAKCAVRFLRAHADALGIDPGRIGAWGSSAGGNLVALLGLAGPEAGFDHGPYAEQPSWVEAVVDMFGVADATDMGDLEPFMRAAAHIALGGSTTKRRAASPVSYLESAPGARSARDDPQFLLLHGSNDHPRHSRSWHGGYGRPGFRSSWCWFRVPSMG